MLQYIAISNVSIFLSGVLYCIAAIDIAIYTTLTPQIKGKSQCINVI